MKHAVRWKGDLRTGSARGEARHRAPPRHPRPTDATAEEIFPAPTGSGDEDTHAGAHRHAGGTRLWMYVPMLLNIVEMSWPRIVAPSATTRAIRPTSRAYSAIVAPFVSRASRRVISIVKVPPFTTTCC